MQTAGKQKQKRNNSSRIRSGAAALCAALLLLLSGCGTAPDAQTIKQQEALTEGTLQDGQMSELQMAEQQENGGSSTEEMAEPGEVQTPDGTLSVTFLDVGQGNAVLVEQGGAYMLIDGGNRDYSSFVVSYLKEQGVEELAYVIASHYDADHLNGVVGALHAFSCGQVLAPDYVTDTRVYESFERVITEQDIALAYPAVGDTYTLGDASFTVVCPKAYDPKEDNDNSVGIRLVYGNTSFLICGDAGKAEEQAMLDSGVTLESDVYLASHHGSEGSSSEAFMRAVSPSAVVVSAGAGNSYGHPTRTVLDRVKACGAALYRTDLQGTITVTSDGTSLSWSVDATQDYRDGDEVAAGAADTTGTSGAADTADSAAQASGGETAAGGTDTTGTSGTAGAAVTDAAGSTDTTGTSGAADTADSAAQASGGETAAGSTADVTGEYVLNTNTKKFHRPSCSSVAQMSPENKAAFSGSREELIAAGYDPCKRCNP